MKKTIQNLQLLLIPLVIILDQASKYWIINVIDLVMRGRIEISKFFNLTMVWNYGVSFGALKANSEIGRWGLVALSLIISVIFVRWMLKSNNGLTKFALGLVIGGALGNMIDRIRFGAVADFLDFSGLYFPWVFNVADMAVVGGALLLIIDMIFNPEDDKILSKENAPDA